MTDWNAKDSERGERQKKREGIWWISTSAPTLGPGNGAGSQVVSQRALGVALVDGSEKAWEGPCSGRARKPASQPVSRKDAAPSKVNC